MGKVLGAAIYPHPPIIMEEIGKGEERKASKTLEGVKALSRFIKEKSPTTIIVITPHGPIFRDAVAISTDPDLYGHFGNFGYRQIQFSYENNIPLVKKIINNAMEEDIMVATVDEDLSRSYNIDRDLDHGSLVPLYFVDKEYKDFKLIHISYGILPPRDLFRFGKAIKRAVLESVEDIIVLASGDLSHKLSPQGPYEYSPYGKEFDQRIVAIIGEGRLEDLIDFDLELAEKAGECGLRSFMIMAGILDNCRIRPQVLSYEGPFGVGYCTAKIDIESPPVRLARESLEHYVREGSFLDLPSDLPEDFFSSRKAVFVTLNKDGELRGCIGTLEPTRENLALEIIRNAVSAGLEDPRFDRVTEEELDSLVYSVDVLSLPEAISSREDLDVKKYGVIVSRGYRRGLLLPNLDGIDTVDQQIYIALKKANIHPDENYSMERFEVVRHH
ncbi:MAG: AmmeMemoRadiSam system protein A [Tissierellaceae bacterium]